MASDGRESADYPDFLIGGGEMGARIRAYDWARTPLRSPQQWPQSLRSALSICLHSSVPTAIYWGPELRLLYNDAWAPVPAERHPEVLGQPAHAVWGDIWGVVGEHFAQVLRTGEGYSTYDQMLPMVRQGAARETYWNYSLTPIRGEDGSIAGIFNQGYETTARVMAERKSLAEREQLRRMFDQAPGFMTMLKGEDHIFDLANRAYLELVGRRDVIGKPIRDALPELEGQGYYELLDKVYESGEPFVGTAVPVDLKRGDGQGIERRFVDMVYQPITDAKRRITGIFIEGSDVTDRVRAEADLRASESRLRFLSELDDRLRASRDASEVMRAAAEHLTLRLGASRTAYADVDADNDRFIVRDDYAAPGIESSAGVYSLNLFGSRVAADLRAGRTVVIRDMKSELAVGEGREMFLSIGIGAIICCPLIKDGKLVAMMAVHQSTARDWQEDEITLAESAVERCWAYVARVGAEARLRDMNETLEQRVTEALAERKIFADLFETTNSFVQIIDPDYRFLAINTASVDEYQRMFGFRPAAGDNLLELILANCPWHHDPIKALWAPALKGETFGEVSEFGAAERRWYDMKLAPVLSADGAIIGASLFGYDVTARIHEQQQLARAEAARREADALYRAYFENTAEALFIINVLEDGGFSIEELNPAHELLTGLRTDEIKGKPLDEQLPADVVAEATGNYRRAVAAGQPISYREVLTLPAGTRHWDTVLVPVANAAGRINKIIGSARDVTAHVQAEEQLRQSQKLEAMGSLTGGVSHDFNNLLSPIIGALDLLQRRGVGGERERRLIDGALQSAERARVLVQRLLAFARRQPLQTISVDVGELVNGMADLIRSTAGPQIKVVVDVEDALPGAVADPNQLEMALLNLSVNARDAMPDGGTLRISAVGDEVALGHATNLTPGSYVRLSVADTGVGMDSETLKRAIEPFYSTKGIGKGTGLGLSMVHGLAAQLGGALTIASEPGVGTNIELWLPVGGTPGQLQGQSAEATVPRDRRGTVLLIDDEEIVRASTADMLVELGFDVIEADSAEEGLNRMAAGLTPDLIVTDHLMPGRSGGDLAMEVRGRWPDLPVLLVSGYAEAEGVAPDQVRLVKPFRQADLAAHIAELTGA
jgi:PAS domain S-box-containing protein